MGTRNFIKQAAHPAQARVLGARLRQRTSMAEKARKREWRRCGPRLLARTSYLSSSRVAPRLQCVACRALGGIWLFIKVKVFVVTRPLSSCFRHRLSKPAHLKTVLGPDLTLYMQVKEQTGQNPPSHPCHWNQTLALAGIVVAGV